MHPTSAAPGPNRLRRQVGFVAAAISGIGIVLGAGIYVLIGEAAGLSGNAVWMSFALAALLAAGTGLSYAELTSMYPESGAAAAFANEAFGRRAAFVTGWMDVAVNAVGAPAVAIGFAGYFAGLFGVDRRLVAVAVVLLCGAITLAGVTATVRLAAAFAALEFTGLVIVIVLGVPFLPQVRLFDAPFGMVGVLGAAALVFFAYEGFEEIATLAEEVHDPVRNIPRALLVAIAVTTAIYVLVAITAIGVVPAEELAASPAPLAEVARRAGSSRLADAISYIALFATFNTVLLLLATGPRAMYGMARRGLLPPALGAVWAARGTPWVAIVFLTSIATAFAAAGDIAFVAQVTNFAVFVLFIIVNGAVIRLRFTQPATERPFRLRPVIANVPLTALVGLLGTCLLGAFLSREAFATGAVTLVTGIALSFVLVPRNPARS